MKFLMHIERDLFNLPFPRDFFLTLMIVKRRGNKWMESWFRSTGMESRVEGCSRNPKKL
jgi:hypothetical protein